MLIRNSRINLELNRKTKQRYLGPYVVINRTKGGSYHLAELDGARLKGRIAAFRIVPYYAREVMSGPPIEPVEEQYSSDDEEEVEDAGEREHWLVSEPANKNVLMLMRICSSESC